MQTFELSMEPQNPITDIVVTTHNRLADLQRTLTHIIARTLSPYRLHVIDDASEEDNVDLLLEDWYGRYITSLLLKNDRNGVAAALNAGTWMTFSDPVVFTDDDVLCPAVNPDWLAQGLLEMQRRPKLALLALHHPGAKHKVTRRDKEVTYCKSIGGTFMFARRQFLVEHPLPHRREGYDVWPTEWRCKAALENGWDVGFLTNVFCYHFGKESVLKGGEYQGRFIEPVNWETLRPSKLVSS